LAAYGGKSVCIYSLLPSESLVYDCLIFSYSVPISHSSTVICNYFEHQ